MNISFFLINFVRLNKGISKQLLIILLQKEWKETI